MIYLKLLYRCCMLFDLSGKLLLRMTSLPSQVLIRLPLPRYLCQGSFVPVSLRLHSCNVICYA